MREIFRDLFGFIYSLNLGDLFFYIATFLVIILFIYVIYLLKCSEQEDNMGEPYNDDILNLLEVTKQIEEEYKPGKIELTGYEEEQEKSAIISYDELIQTKERPSLNYDDEYVFEEPELDVKKIDLAHNGTKVPETKIEVRLMSYEKEEAFLEALKQLQRDLAN